MTSEVCDAELKSLGAKRVMRQNKTIGFSFVLASNVLASPMLCQNIFPQNEL